MTILYFYQYFTTPNGSWGTRVYDFAKQWTKEGSKVIVITSIYAKSDLKAKKFIETQLIDGIEVKIININIDNKNNNLQRIFGFLLYSLIATYYALTIKCDKVIASSGPISVAIPGLAAKFFRRRKLIFEVRDLWPQGAIELGVLNNKLIQKMAFLLEQLTYSISDLIVVLSPGMISNIDSRFKYGYKCISIPNSINIDLFQNYNAGSVSFFDFSYAIYTGNIGDVNNSIWLLNAARELDLRNIKNLKILMIGDGKLKKDILNAVETEGIKSLVFFELMPKIELVKYIQNAIVSLVPLKGTPILDTSSPNKFFESLGAGVPVIQNTNGWMKDFLNDNNVGITINPNDHISLVEELIKFNNLNSKEKLSLRNRCLEVGKQFDKNLLSKMMLNRIKQI